MIAVGAITYLNCPNRIVGAFLFPIGLIVIMEFGFRLYTGCVGYARSKNDVFHLLITFLMNAVGCAFVMCVPTQGAESVWLSRLDTSLWMVFAKGFICGILIFACVFKRDVLITMIAIPAFIICGAEHSIADICFMFAAQHFTIEGVIFILVVAMGNATGSLVVSLWMALSNKTNRRDTK